MTHPLLCMSLVLALDDSDMGKLVASEVGEDSGGPVDVVL